MSEYTPSTEQDTAHYREAVSILASGLVSKVEQQRFDRWLASVKAEAFDEGVDVGWDARGVGPDPVNPYRGENA